MAIGMGAALIGSAIIGGGVSFLGGKKAAKAQKQAAQTAANSATQADATNRYIFDTTREDFRPQREIGNAATSKLASMYGVSAPGGVPGMVTGGEGSAPGSMMPGASVTAPGGRYGGFETSPGYQFRVDEAMKAIERSAAARGSLRSGATMDALQRRVQGVASNEYENYTDRLMQLAGIGERGNAGSATAGAQFAAGSRDTARMAGDAAMAAGNARASGYANTANAVNNTVSNVAQAFLYNRGFGGGGGGSTPRSGWGTPGLY